MSKFVLVFIAFSLSNVASAGPEMDQFFQRLATYRFAEEASTSKPISYSDNNGIALKVLLSPSTAEDLLAEAQAEPQNIQRFQQVFRGVNTVAEIYELAFTKTSSERYEDEFLDGFDLAFRLFSGIAGQLFKVNLEQVDADTKLQLEEAQESARLGLQSKLGELEAYIENGDFSSDYKDEAQQRLDALRALTEETLSSDT